MELVRRILLATEGVSKSGKPDLKGGKVHKSLFQEVRGRIDGEGIGPIRSGDSEAGHASCPKMKRSIWLEMPYSEPQSGFHGSVSRQRRKRQPSAAH